MIIRPMLKCRLGYFLPYVYPYVVTILSIFIVFFSVFNYYKYKSHFLPHFNSIKCLHSVNSTYKSKCVKINKPKVAITIKKAEIQ